MSTMHTTSTENVFTTGCVGCPRTASVHQRRRSGLDGFNTFTMWRGPRVAPAPHQCAVHPDALATNESMLRARAHDDEVSRGRQSSWNFSEAPTTQVPMPPE